MYSSLLASTDVLYPCQTLQEGEQLRAASPGVVRLVASGHSQGSSGDSASTKSWLALDSSAQKY